MVFTTELAAMGLFGAGFGAAAWAIDRRALSGMYCAGSRVETSLCGGAAALLGAAAARVAAALPPADFELFAHGHDIVELEEHLGGGKGGGRCARGVSIVVVGSNQSSWPTVNSRGRLWSAVRSGPNRGLITQKQTSDVGGGFTSESATFDSLCGKPSRAIRSLSSRQKSALTMEASHRPLSIPSTTSAELSDAMSLMPA